METFFRVTRKKLPKFLISRFSFLIKKIRVKRIFTEIPHFSFLIPH